MKCVPSFTSRNLELATRLMSPRGTATSAINLSSGIPRVGSHGPPITTAIQKRATTDMGFRNFKIITRTGKAALCALLILVTGCATIDQLRCAPHNEKAPPFPENQLTECLSTNTFWASHPVVCFGNDSSKPPVILLHELPGLSSQTLHYAKSLSSDFRVYVPLLFGTPNQSSAFRGSISFRTNGEWTPRSELAGNSHIVKWLQHVTTQIQERHPGQSIGVIGNCLTGAIPLALLNNTAVTAVVLAQPALPLPFLYYSDEDESSLDISDHAKTQALSRKDAWVYYLHFETDCAQSGQKRQLYRLCLMKGLSMEKSTRMSISLMNRAQLQMFTAL